MPGTNSNMSDYLPQIVQALTMEGVPEPAISDYRKYWHLLPAERRDAPCPYCFREGVDARLLMLGRGALRDRLQCSRCKRTLEFLDPGAPRGRFESQPGDEAGRKMNDAR